MQNAIAALSRLNAVLCRISLWLAGSGLALMTAIVFAQVFQRYVMNHSLLWVEPVAIMLMSWFIFLGAAVGVYERFHMGFDVLTHFLPDAAGRWMRLVSDLAILAFAIGMMVYGWQLLAKTWPSRIPVVGLPGGVTYLPLIVGGALMTLFVLEHILRAPGGTAHTAPTDADVEDVLMTEA